jgi:uncharacterized membrane protein YjjP (DUF1212 family)
MNQSVNAPAAISARDLTPFLSDLSELLLKWSWEGVVGCEAVVEQVARSYGNTDTSVYMTAQSAAIKVGTDVTFVKIGIPDIPPLGATQDLKNLLADIYSGKMPLPDASKALTSIAGTKPRYAPFLVLIGIIAISIGFAVDVVGTWEGIIWAAFAAVFTGAVFLLQDKIEGFDKVAQLVATFSSGVVVMMAWKAGWTSASPGLLLIASTFVFIPGDSISTQAYELAEGGWSAGVDRLFYAIIMLILMAAGAVFAAAATGTQMAELFLSGPRDGFAWWAVYPARVVFVVGILLVFQMRWAHFVPAMLTLWIATAVAQGTTMVWGGLAGTFCAMVVGTILADWQARGPHSIPAYVLLIPVVFALSPGSHGLRQLETWVSGTHSADLQDASTLVSTMLAIAIALIVGRIISHPWR